MDKKNAVLHDISILNDLTSKMSGSINRNGRFYSEESVKGALENYIKEMKAKNTFTFYNIEKNNLVENYIEGIKENGK